LQTALKEVWGGEKRKAETDREFTKKDLLVRSNAKKKARRIGTCVATGVSTKGRAF